MRTLDAELRRFLSRRLIRWMFLLVAIAFVVAGIVVFFRSTDTGDAFSVAQPFHLERFRGISIGMSGLFIPLAVLLGASFIGAEWHTRSMTASLTFEPRRGVLLAGKLAAAAIVTIVATFVFQGLLFLCLTPAALARGTTTGLDSAWWLEVLGNVSRVALLSAFGAVIGATLAMIGRNAAAALGVGFVYFAIIEQLIRQMRPQFARWLIGDSIALVAAGEEDPFWHPGRTPMEAGFTLLAYALALALVSFVLFRNRDVA